METPRRPAKTSELVACMDNTVMARIKCNHTLSNKSSPVNHSTTPNINATNSTNAQVPATIHPLPEAQHNNSTSASNTNNSSSVQVQDGGDNQTSSTTNNGDTKASSQDFGVGGMYGQHSDGTISRTRSCLCKISLPRYILQGGISTDNKIE
ncbi:ETS-like protein pointed [Ctenocephalides felis]|uniref:ETS-like protein pointed n=1 Tax=Ctenocephalides felis TaxID=7515 RepID=UPI000E6E20CB|nr:ETS-like protein pointed [Ctenocephalides felis]